MGRLVEGGIRVGDTLHAHVDGERRRATALNHSATHLAARGAAQGVGYARAAERLAGGARSAAIRLLALRAHFTAVQLQEIERLVNAQIRLNTEAQTKVMDYEGAVAAGAMALFGEKYEKDVRVLRIGDFSMELCGGTHVGRSGDIGFFKITSEGGVASGVRRIEAITGEAAIEYVEQSDAC
jgi:alanyl-tRNA synthetase